MSTRPRFSLSALLALALALLAMLSPAQAQVLVYKFRIAPDRTVNLDFYNAGWFVVSPLGGDGSFIFTKKSTEGNVYAKEASGGTLFTGVTEEGKHKSVIEATQSSGDTSTKSSFLAFGSMNKAMRFVGPGFDIETDIATKLTGMVIASTPATTTTSSSSTDGDTSTGTTTTDSPGFAGVFDWSVSLDTKTTNASNAKGYTIDQTITNIETTLKQSNYTEEDSSVENLEITTNAVLEEAAAGVSKTYTIAATGGVTAYKWSLVNPDPTGAITINSSTGVLTVNVAGAVTNLAFDIKVTDSASAPDTATKTFFLTAK